MRGRRTIHSNVKFELEGGTRENDLWVHRYSDENWGPCVSSVWEPTPDERARIAAGENVELICLGTRIPPLLMRTSDVPLDPDQT